MTDVVLDIDNLIVSLGNKPQAERIIRLETKVDGQSGTVKGSVGSGPQITAMTNRGTLSIKKK